MIQIYTGPGKGKTTAALGLALRAVGAGRKVLLIQFLKDGRSSEMKIIKNIKNFELRIFGPQEDSQLVAQGFNFAQKAVKSKKYNLIILDEINVALNFGLIEQGSLLELMKIVPTEMDLVLTGRWAEKEIIEQADLVSEVKEVKHYFQKGVKARPGIEY